MLEPETDLQSKFKDPEPKAQYHEIEIGDQS